MGKYQRCHGGERIMLNEYLEFEAYVTNPTSPNPRVQPKLLTDHFKKGGYLIGIESIMTVVARGFIFLSEKSIQTGNNLHEIIDDARELLHRWTGFADNDNIKRTDNPRIEGWLQKFPEADGWLKNYWEFQYKTVNKKKEVDAELWKELEEKWNLRLSNSMDYCASTFNYNNIIANALEMGALKHRYFVVKKIDFIEKKGYESQENQGSNFAYLYDYIKGRQEESYMKVIKIIVAYLIKQESHPVGQNEVWIRNGELAGWYGLDDGKNGVETFYPSRASWQDRPIYTRYSLRKNFSKLSIDSEYLKEFDYRIIEKEEADRYRETHWVLDDLGHGLRNCWQYI